MEMLLFHSIIGSFDHGGIVAVHGSGKLRVSNFFEDNMQDASFFAT